MAVDREIKTKEEIEEWEEFKRKLASRCLDPATRFKARIATFFLFIFQGVCAYFLFKKIQRP